MLVKVLNEESDSPIVVSGDGQKLLIPREEENAERVWRNCYSLGYGVGELLGSGKMSQMVESNVISHYHLVNMAKKRFVLPALCILDLCYLGQVLNQKEMTISI